MAKGPSKVSRSGTGMSGGDGEYRRANLGRGVVGAGQRVLKIQTKLHQWASDDPSRVFADLFNLVTDPAFLMIAWDRVRGNQGARSAGVDGVRPRLLQSVERAFLTGLHQQVKSGEFAPLPVRERMIPKRSGKLRGLGIPTTADRVVQASLKLVLEPIFEADFLPCSYGFRPKRRAQDAIAEIHMLASNAYEWVLDADISACSTRSPTRRCEPRCTDASPTSASWGWSRRS